ncbi:MAG: hypothetical protein IJW64_02945 [Clostridia bacterium]|nr:hypothetical protein [Clostridia bacterium]
MKKKYLSLVCSILSLVIATTFLIFTVVLIFRVASGNEYVPEVQEGLWIVEVFSRIQKAGLNVFLSILGIVLSVVLIVYRIMIAYFYSKIYKSDDKFYKERLGENVFFAILAGVAAIIFGVLSFGAKPALPPEFNPLMIVFFALYSLVFIIPLVEIAVVYIVKACAKTKKVVTAPSKDDILDELDNLADKTATDIVSEKSQSKEENQNETQE